jgi:hypothetical protein
MPKFGAAHASCLRNHPRQRSLVVVRIEAQTSVSNAAVPLDVRRLYNHERRAGMGQHAEMHEMPVIRTAVVGGILAHR